LRSPGATIRRIAACRAAPSRPSSPVTCRSARPAITGWAGTLLRLNPFTHLAITYQEILYFDGPVGHWYWLLVLGGISIAFFFFGYFVFDRLRDTFAEEV